jgi:hypothetical protein
VPPSKRELRPEHEVTAGFIDAAAVDSVVFIRDVFASGEDVHVLGRLPSGAEVIHRAAVRSAGRDSLGVAPVAGRESVVMNATDYSEAK